MSEAHLLLRSRPHIPQAGVWYSLAMDTLNEAVGAAINMPFTDTITHIGFSCRSKTGYGAGTPYNVYTAQIESISGVGIPNGIFSAGASVTFPTNGGAYPSSGFGTGTYHWVELGTPPTLNVGQNYAITIQRTGATDAANFFSLGAGVDGDLANDLLPYVLTANSTPTWSKSPLVSITGFAMKSATRYYGLPVKTIGQNVAFGNTTEGGFLFTIPSAFRDARFGLRRVTIQTGSGGFAAVGLYHVTLYADPLGAPIILEQGPLRDSDITGSGSADSYMPFTFDVANMPALIPGVEYGVGFSMNISGSNIAAVTLPDAASHAAFGFGGFSSISRTIAAFPPVASDGAFTETAAASIWAELMFTEYRGGTKRGFIHPLTSPTPA